MPVATLALQVRQFEFGGATAIKPADASVAATDHGRSEDEVSTGIPARNIKLKRAYEAPDAQDGTRILVDRLWPRGVRKADAAIDHWFKELAPSTALRVWFDHEPARWEAFKRRYAAELAAQSDRMKDLRRLAKQGSVTLVYAAHDVSHNDATALRNILLGR
jgi:uncharacterized protein YeaO (DUF488 family)